jgi:hypothetical protein
LYTIVARERLYQCGPNEISAPDAPSYLHIFLDELYEGPQLLLMAVGVAYALLGSMEEACTALVVILLMINAEIVTEFRAKRALARLQSTVREGGREGGREECCYACSFSFLVYQAHIYTYLSFLPSLPPSPRSPSTPPFFGTRAKRSRFLLPLSCPAISSSSGTNFTFTCLPSFPPSFLSFHPPFPPPLLFSPHTRTITLTPSLPPSLPPSRAGQAVPADVFLLSASSLEIDEAAITGESIPNHKRAGARGGGGGREGGREGGVLRAGSPTPPALSVVVMGGSTEEGEEERRRKGGKAGGRGDVLISEQKAYAGT